MFFPLQAAEGMMMMINDVSGSRSSTQAGQWKAHVESRTRAVCVAKAWPRVLLHGQP